MQWRRHSPTESAAGNRRRRQRALPGRWACGCSRRYARPRRVGSGRAAGTAAITRTPPLECQPHRRRPRHQP
nr:hypothetical protein [Xanthomonas vasicola]